MTEAERLAEDEKLGKFDRKRKSNYKYLQKYYHKGVFYMDDDSLAKEEDDVRKKIYDAPTLEDRYAFNFIKFSSYICFIHFIL